jgi:hypothetical protein
MLAISEFLITLFESLGLYSSQNGLSEHLRGLNVKCDPLLGYSQQPIYSMVFLSLFIINSLIIINYYYGVLNRIPFNRFLWWALSVLLGSVILFLISFLYANNDFTSGNICPDLSVTSSDCLGFGITSAIFSIIWCCILSVIIKWKSSVNKKVPF